MIGAQEAYTYRLSIDGHKLTVIATDTKIIEPVVTDYIIIFSGERYDFLVTANQTNQTDFWMRAETLEVDISFSLWKTRLPPFRFLTENNALAVIHYNRSQAPRGAEYGNITNITRECTEESPCITVNCPFKDYHPTYNHTCINVDKLILFHPTPRDQLPSAEFDEEYFLNFGFENKQFQSTINARSSIPYKISPQVDRDLRTSYEALLCNLNDTCFPDGCYCTHQLNIPFNKTIRFIFSTAGLSVNNRRFSHPIHLHGHFFHVVKVGYGVYNATNGRGMKPTKDILCQEGSTKSFCIKPYWNGMGPEIFIDQHTIQKDTVVLPALGYVIIHFKSTNPGLWLLHCHIEQHFLEGMVIAINEAESRQPPAPPGMKARGNFTWTVEEFKKALQFDADAQEEMTSENDDLSRGAIIGISVGVTAAVFIVLTLVAVVIVYNYYKEETYIRGWKGRKDATATSL